MNILCNNVPYFRFSKSLWTSRSVQLEVHGFLSKNVVRGDLLIPIDGQVKNMCHRCVRRLSMIRSRPTRSLVKEIRAFSRLLSRSSLLADTRFLASGHYNWGPNRYFSTTNPRQQNQKDGDEKPQEDPVLSPFHLFLVVLGVALFVNLLRDDQSNLNYITWNDFYHHMLSKGEVKEIQIYRGSNVAFVKMYDGAMINGQQTRQYYFLKIADFLQFEEKLKKAEDDLNIPIDQRVPVTYHSSKMSFTTMLLIAAALMFLLTRGKGSMNFPNMMDSMFKDQTKAKFVLVDNMTTQGKGVTFKDVAGLKEAKIEVMEFVDYLKNPLRYQELGAKIPRGALLLGPPGCGKTLLAKAVATESKVPFLAMAGSEFVEMIGGLGSSRVRNLFAEARKRSPCIVYIDELDAIGKKRGNGSNEEEDQTLNQLLVEMDGMGTQDGVIMLGSTNRADILDTALLRPGRFDRHITIDLPTMIEREETYEMYLKKLKMKQNPRSYSRRLSQMTPGMSGADIANICNEAAIHAARETKKDVDTNDLEYAVERTIAGVAKKSRLLSPAEKKICAYHEMGHALTGWLLKNTDALLRVSIIPRTNNALGFAQYLPSERKLYSTEQLFERMCMALGGRAAEAIIFNHITTGAEDDLKRVTNLAYSQIRTYGMNERVGYLSFPSPEETGRRPFSKRLAQVIDEEARSLVNRAYRTTEQILQDNKDKLHLLAEHLLEKEVLTYDDIKQLIGPPPHGEKNKLEPIGWIDGVGVDMNGDIEEKKPKKKRKNQDA